MFLQGILASGTYLKMRANRQVMAEKEKTKFIACRISAGKGMNSLKNFPIAASAALRISDASKRKPIASTIANEKILCFTKPLASFITSFQP
jgi:hypothetical protein